MHTVMSVAQHIILEALRSIKHYVLQFFKYSIGRTESVKRSRFTRQGFLFLFPSFRLRNYIKEGVEVVILLNGCVTKRTKVRVPEPPSSPPSSILLILNTSVLRTRHMDPKTKDLSGSSSRRKC